MRAALILIFVSVMCTGCLGTRGQVAAAPSEVLPAFMTYGDCRTLIEVESEKACAAAANASLERSERQANEARRAVQQFDPQCAGHADLQPLRARAIACANALQFGDPVDVRLATR